MNRTPVLYFTMGAWALAATGCNLPQQDAAAIQTSAAMTVQAEITASAPSATATSTTAPFPTLPIVTATIAPPASPTSTCDVAQFVTDVTVPDDTIIAPNASFTKTWRLKNIGPCSWTPSYAIVFADGEAMSGPATQSLTTNVNPGQTVDLSVDLKAPASTGTYTGNWRLRNTVGVNFTKFYVRIKVQPPGPQSVDLFTVGAEDGHVQSTGQVAGPPNIGDSAENAGREAFLSFDISGIPSSATVTKVVTDFRDYDTVGDPFTLGNDGCIRAYVQDFGTLDAGDFFNGDPTNAVARWCSAAELDTAAEQVDMKGALQSQLGESRFQIRIQFRPPLTDNDGAGDVIRLGDVKLVVTYTTP